MGTRVFVGGLSYRVRERDIKKCFGKYGRIEQVAMNNGFAFVDFDDYRDADDAVYHLNDKELLGKRMGTRVFVGGLTYRVRERDIEKFFRKYGRIKEVAMKNGFAFVEFDDYRDADDAVYELNGKELLGERVSVERARGMPRGSDQWRRTGRRSGPPRDRNRDNRDPDMRSHDRYGPPTRTDYRLIVENLSSRVSWQDLKDYMRQSGEVTYADAHKQRRNEGVVEFASYSDMKNAIEKLDDTELNGRRIRLVEDRRKGRRTHTSSSRSRSRSRSRHRSNSRSGSRSNGGGSKSRSRSRSNTKRSKSRTPSKDKEQSKDHSRSRSVSKDRSKSVSRSPAKEESASSDKND
ncbi:hypothetical protein FQR65_LT13593 [Abscondita terminalis]|nr:hypothetical protein FQR65_LT13593 [Abscondita terminalis]